MGKPFPFSDKSHTGEFSSLERTSCSAVACGRSSAESGGSLAGHSEGVRPVSCFALGRDLCFFTFLYVHHCLEYRWWWSTGCCEYVSPFILFALPFPIFPLFMILWLLWKYSDLSEQEGLFFTQLLPGIRPKGKEPISEGTWRQEEKNLHEQLFGTY